MDDKKKTPEPSYWFKIGLWIAVGFFVFNLVIGLLAGVVLGLTGYELPSGYWLAIFIN